MKTIGITISLVSLALLAGGAHAAQSREKLTVYAVPATAQFMNHADDRLRGMSSNPFNIRTQDLVMATKGKEKKNGPFPGDDILYSFKLYTSPKRGARLGAAMFTCYYTFGKRATCDAYLELKRGVVLASGPVRFNSTHFSLSVTGGTGRFLGALGAIEASPAAANAERLEFTLLGTAR